MAVVNQVGQPRMALPTFVSFPASHAYREGGLGLVWDTCLQQLVEPNVDEKERAMGFPTGMPFVPSIFEASRRQVLGQAMDLNCLTWIVSLGMVEQRQLRATFVIVTPFVSSLPTGTVEASTGGEESYTFHPWNTWDVLGEHVKVVAHVVEEFVAPVVFHWVTWRSVWLLPRFLHSNPWHRPLPLVCLLRKLGSL